VQPGFDRLVFREFTNQVAQETAFRNGEIDQLGCPPARYVQLVKDKDVLDRTQHYEYQSVSGGYNYIAWNQQRYGKPTKFSDKRVRQAMTLLTDAQRILSEVRLGYGVLATGPFNPVSKQYDPSLKPWPFDPDRASKLLADVGWKEQGGVLVDAEGKPFSFKLTYPSGNPTTDKMVLLLKDLYARAKVRMELDPQEWSVFKTRLENREFDAITLGWSAGIETDLFQMFHSSMMSGGGDDFMSYKNPELDKTIVEARRTLDEASRMKLWQKCHQIIYEDQPYTFLLFPKALVFMDKRIANVKTVKSGINGDSEWYVPKAQQRWTK
jgi:peptide/nickel transport system substrate-binding protein